MEQNDSSERLVHQNESSERFLHQNCRATWPEWTCITANVCGLFSTAVWFVVLLPQVWKNFRRKSVRGLSVLWATANFTASLINLFFVFIYASIPIYGQISSVYSPVLEFALLIQFWVYGNYRRTEKFAFLAGCLVVWGTVIAVELIFSVENFVEYAAILLWCIETFPQVILNMKLQSTSGQSTGSVVIAMVGKTTDFISNNGLVLPLQYVIMVYFSTSVAYINGIQVAWYYGKEANEGRDVDVDVSKPRPRSHLGPTLSYPTTSVTDDAAHVTGGNVNSNQQADDQIARHHVLVNCLRWTCISVLSVLLVACIVGFSFNVNSYFGLFAPFSIATILVTAQSYLTGCRAASFTLKHTSIE